MSWTVANMSTVGRPHNSKISNVSRNGDSIPCISAVKARPEQTVCDHREAAQYVSDS